jgi:hypothetical protein
MLLRKLITLVFSCVSLLVAATPQTPINWTGLGDTASFANVKNDTLRFSTAFLCNSEKHAAAFVFSDTANDDRSSDSINVEIGYQMGFPVKTLENTLDTIWSNRIVLDSINTVDSGAMYNPSKLQGALWTYGTAFGSAPAKVANQIDSTIGTASVGVLTSFDVLWSPLIRFYVRGKSDNCGSFIRAKVYNYQRQYNNVRVQ